MRPLIFAALLSVAAVGHAGWFSKPTPTAVPTVAPTPVPTPAKPAKAPAGRLQKGRCYLVVSSLVKAKLCDFKIEGSCISWVEAGKYSMVCGDWFLTEE